MNPNSNIGGKNALSLFCRLVYSICSYRMSLPACAASDLCTELPTFPIIVQTKVRSSLQDAQPFGVVGANHKRSKVRSRMKEGANSNIITMNEDDRKSSQA